MTPCDETVRVKFTGTPAALEYLVKCLEAEGLSVEASVARGARSLVTPSRSARPAVELTALRTWN